MINASVRAVFVYGTLKTGQCREKCWPRQPREIRRAWTRGELYDTGPYPALFPGDDQVGGQLWLFDDADMQMVLEALDPIEDYVAGRESTNLYNRQVIECFDEEGGVFRAFTYIYAQAQQRPSFERVPPHYSVADLRLALWPVGVDW